MAQQYDVAIVGGGHNGLVAAAYLAREGPAHPGARAAPHRGRGRRQRAAVRARLHPHEPVLRRVLAAAHARARPRSGAPRLPRLPAGPVLRAARRRPLPAAARRQGRAPAREISKFSAKDADAVERWDEWMDGLGKVLGPLVTEIPPKVGSRSPATSPGRRCCCASSTTSTSARPSTSPACSPAAPPTSSRTPSSPTRCAGCSRCRPSSARGPARARRARRTSSRTTTSATSATGASAPGASPAAAWAA